MELVSRLLLRAIDAYETEHPNGPTAPELAADLRVPPDFGHHHLVERLARQVVLGRVSHYGGRFCLTDAGRDALLLDTWGSSPQRAAHPLSEPTSEPARTAQAKP